MSIGLVWLGNDLRTADQKLLWAAQQQVDELLFVACLTPDITVPMPYQLAEPSMRRERFYFQGLDDLACSLESLGQLLYVSEQSAMSTLSVLLNELPITHVFRNHHPGWYERQTLANLQAEFADVQFVIEHGLSLFTEQQLPFALADLPSSFSKFRKQVEPLNLPSLYPEITSLPSSRALDLPYLDVWPARRSDERGLFTGGELAGLTHLSDYFATDLPSRYKTLRNELDGWENSTKFSPWLAQGSVSPRQIKACLDVYEQDHGANDSTYWIYFELLWREYFHWYATLHGKGLFVRDGITGQGHVGSYYAERFKKWCQGNTPYPIVNACMKQLNQTGYMSNRGRQLAASCLIYELGIDWRYGAAYFESQLVDYDVGANWGNWQYIAGVGADPRGGRHFNLEKQTQQYDPEGRFIEKWSGHQHDPQLDSVDAADWPIIPK
ncbi:DASH family cryptochrome [Marinomonas ostreistagni]|uniref:DASH family cryptochrome n=1 Tax=Marinomonas ostreistagni TaxID=359209 RepID=UPI0019522F38|nr:DASH family cryptochrome [Marinomonas ostreistagni]MBM6550978.1 DASH family cryptochrome [Marinomonas ostreistagni]